MTQDWRTLMLFEAVFVGWSERDRRFKLWAMNSYEGFTPREDGGEFYGLLPFPQLGDLMPAVGRLSPTQQRIEVLKAHRRLTELPGMCGMVGGDVQEWTSTEDGMSQQVIWRFPDATRDQAEGAGNVRALLSGQRDSRSSLSGIADGRSAPGAESAPAMTRQQRRAMERQNRRVRA